MRQPVSWRHAAMSAHSCRTAGGSAAASCGRQRIGRCSDGRLPGCWAAQRGLLARLHAQPHTPPAAPPPLLVTCKLHARNGPCCACSRHYRSSRTRGIHDGRAPVAGDAAARASACRAAHTVMLAPPCSTSGARSNDDIMGASSAAIASRDQIASTKLRGGWGRGCMHIGTGFANRHSGTHAFQLECVSPVVRTHSCVEWVTAAHRRRHTCDLRLSPRACRSRCGALGGALGGHSGTAAKALHFDERVRCNLVFELSTFWAQRYARSKGCPRAWRDRRSPAP